MKGAVQGLATNTASAPVAKLPRKPPRAAICPPALIGQQQHAFKRGEVLWPLRPLQRQFQPIRAMAKALRRGVIQKPSDARDEQRFLQAFAPKAGASQTKAQRLALNGRTGLPG